MGRRNYCRFNILRFTSASVNRVRRAQPCNPCIAFWQRIRMRKVWRELYCSIYYLSGFKLLLLFSIQRTENTLLLQTFPTVSHHIKRQLLFFTSFLLCYAVFLRWVRALSPCVCVALSCQWDLSCWATIKWTRQQWLTQCRQHTTWWPFFTAPIASLHVVATPSNSLFNRFEVKTKAIRIFAFPCKGKVLVRHSRRQTISPLLHCKLSLCSVEYRALSAGCLVHQRISEWVSRV